MKKIIVVLALALVCVGCGASPPTTHAPVRPTPPSTGGTQTPYPTSFASPTRTTQPFAPTASIVPLLPPAMCRSHSDLQDAVCTPGVILFVGTDALCVPGYTRTVRNVTALVRAQVFAEYGIRTHASGQYEIDHLIPLELGGSNDIRNLWPQTATKPYGYHEKDTLENVLHSLVCTGKKPLHDAQAEISTNWIVDYQKYVLNTVMP